MNNLLLELAFLVVGTIILAVGLFSLIILKFRKKTNIGLFTYLFLTVFLNIYDIVVLFAAISAWRGI